MKNHVIFRPWQWKLWLSGLVGSRYDGLRQFSVVEPGVLMRCGQPTVRDLELVRDKHGLRCIVAARGGTRHPLRGAWFRRQRAFCARHGIRLEHMPLSDANRPSLDVFERFLAIVADPANQPTLVHCEQGLHRTGILVAAFRVAHCGWTLERAVEELRARGFETQRPKRQGLLAALAEWAEAGACRGAQPGAPRDHGPRVSDTTMRSSSSRIKSAVTRGS